MFGCDDCLAVCPWNKFAARGARGPLARARRDRQSRRSPSCWQLDDAAFRTRFAGTPVKRTGRDRFLRNVLIAAGNSGDASLLPRVEALLDDHFAAGARHGRVGPAPALGRRHRRGRRATGIWPARGDSDVRAEWARGSSA